jgi:hypothetical protein
VKIKSGGRILMTKDEEIRGLAWLESLTTELHLEAQQQAEQARESARYHAAIAAKLRVLWPSVKERARAATSTLQLCGKTERERQVGFTLISDGFRLHVACFPAMDMSLILEEAGHLIRVSETSQKNTSSHAETRTRQIDIGLQGESLTMEIGGQFLSGKDGLLEFAFRQVLTGRCLG